MEFLILDNYGTPKKVIQRWLARRPRYDLHFRPTGRLADESRGRMVCDPHSKADPLGHRSTHAWNLLLTIPGKIHSRTRSLLNGQKQRIKSLRPLPALANELISQGPSP